MKLFKKKTERQTFDKETYTPIIKSSICTGEQVAGFQLSPKKESNCPFFGQKKLYTIIEKRKPSIMHNAVYLCMAFCGKVEFYEQITGIDTYN